MTGEELTKVKRFVFQKTCNIKDLQHNCEHAKRVASNAERVVKLLKSEKKVDLNLLLAISFLHDINHAFFKPGFINYFLESKRLRAVLPKILEELNIKECEGKIIENAIYKSPLSFPFKKLNKNQDLYTQILQDADTLDLFSKEREISFNIAKGNLLFYKILSTFSKFTFKYGRENLKKYLNFPQLAKEFYVQKS